MKILILGGTKFIGRAILEELKDNNKIFLLNRGNCPIDGIFQIIGNRDEELKMLTDYSFDITIDISGMNRKHIINTLPYLKTKKYIFISSSAVYDIDSIKAPFKETDLVNINSIWTGYGMDKIEAEKAIINSKINYIIIRPPYVYGDNNYVAREGFIINELKQNHPIFIPETNNKIQFTYVKDLAKVIRDLIYLDVVNEIYNIGGDILSFTEWVNLIGKAIGITPIIKFAPKDIYVRDYFPFYDYDNYLDSSKLDKICYHHTDFIEGIKGYINSQTLLVIKDIVKKTINKLNQ